MRTIEIRSYTYIYIYTRRSMGGKAPHLARAPAPALRPAPCALRPPASALRPPASALRPPPRGSLGRRETLGSSKLTKFLPN